MTVGSPAGHIFYFALPLLAGSFLQQFYNMVDSWVVGNFVGDGALAAVGVGAPVIFLFSSLFMGVSRVIFGKLGEKVELDTFMKGSTLLCIASYLLISLSPIPELSLIGCSICGFSVGIMWPGTFSKAAVALKTGGTAMFALLALGGDLGCSFGPAVVGIVSDMFMENMKLGILVSIVFPVGLAACLFSGRKNERCA
jgi:MFS family permease